MKKKISMVLIIIVVILIMAFICLKLLIDKISPIIMEYSLSEMRKIASTIINCAITKDMVNEMDLDKLFIIDKSEDEEIITVTLDPSIVNNLITNASDAVEKGLHRIEIGDDGVLDDFNISEDYFKVPSGIIFNSAFLNNIGPKIPIKLKLVGNVTSGVISDVKEYGINNSLLTISMEISVEIKVILPLTTDYVSITNHVPIAIKLIQGKVPIYYGDGLILDSKKGSTN